MNGKLLLWDFLGKKNLVWGNYFFPKKNRYQETEKRMEEKLMAMIKGRELIWERFV